MTRVVLTCVCVVLLGASLAAQDFAAPARLSLEQAWRLADERNPTLTAAREAVSRAEAGLPAAGARPNPTLNLLSEGYAFSNGGNSSFANAQEVTLKVDQEFELGGKRGLRQGVAQAGVEAARAELANHRRQLLLEVRRAYLAAVLAQADFDVATATLGEIDRLVAMNRARFEQGEISGVELRRLQVERFRFADDRFTAELASKNARGTLLALLNVTPLDQRFALTDGLAPAQAPPAPPAPPVAPGTPGTPGTSTAEAISARPDVQAARIEQDAATRDIQLQQALGKSNVSVGLGYRRDFGQNGLVLDVTVPLPFFERNPGGIARASADSRLASAKARSVELGAALDVNQARNAIDVSTGRLAYIEREYLKNAREARDIVLASYQAGASTLTDYLDAERALREAQRVQNRALFDCRLSVFLLDAALGAPVPSASPDVRK